MRRLFPLYMQPLREGRQLQAPSLYSRIRPQVQQCLQGLQLGGLRQQQHAAPPAAAAWGEGKGGAARRACSAGLAFELPYVSKFLLLAAHIASRNKPTTDRAVFDPGFRKRGQRNPQAMDRQVGGWVVVVCVMCVCVCVCLCRGVRGGATGQAPSRLGAALQQRNGRSSWLASQRDQPCGARPGYKATSAVTPDAPGPQPGSMRVPEPAAHRACPRTCTVFSNAPNFIMV